MERFRTDHVISRFLWQVHQQVVDNFLLVCICDVTRVKKSIPQSATITIDDVFGTFQKQENLNNLYTFRRLDQGEEGRRQQRMDWSEEGRLLLGSFGLVTLQLLTGNFRYKMMFRKALRSRFSQSTVQGC